MMKKGLVFFILLVFSIIIVSCVPKNTLFEQVFNETLIIYQDGDNENHVTKDVTLITTSEAVKTASLTWKSSDDQVIKIEGNTGKVTRGVDDLQVTLTVTVTINKETKTKDFLLTVIKIEENNNDEEEPVDPVDPIVDVTPPVISGTKSWILFVGEEEPDFLENVTALDETDGEVEVYITHKDVNINQIGTYSIIYEAKDKSGNTAHKTIEVIVLPLNQQEEVTYTETFDNLSSSSSYNDFTYQGINGITWKIYGSRTDQTLNNKAITFGGKNQDKSRLEATIQGGIKDFSVKLQKGFSNDNPRKLELYINGELKGTFELDVTTNDIQVFEVKDINVQGEFTLELKQITNSSRSQIIIDDLSWTTYSEISLPKERLVLEYDLNNLEIITNYMENTTFELPSKGSFGSEISWSYTNVNDPNNAYYNLETKKVSIPSSGVVNISVTATLNYGDFEVTKVFKIKIGEEAPLTVSEVKQEANGTRLIVKGVITDIYETNEAIYLTLQDSSSGIMVKLSKEYLERLETQKEVIITGTKKTINNLVTIEDVTKVVVTDDASIDPIYVSKPSNLNSNLGRVVYIEGLLAYTYTNNVTEYLIINENGAFNLLIPQDLVNKEVIQNLFKDRDRGVYVEVVGSVSYQNGKYYVLLTNPEHIEVGLFVDYDMVKKVLLSNLIFPTFPNPVTRDLKLLNNDDLLFGTTITWSSNNPSVISNTGKVVQQDNEVVVRLSYEIKYDDVVIHTGYYDVTVSGKTDYSGYYASINGLTGYALKEELKRITSIGYKKLDYKETSYILDETDADPKRPGYVILVYNRASVSGEWDGGSTWNKEHIWPQSKLNGASDSDLHNLKPSNPSINSSRDNLPYVDGSGTYGKRNGGWYPGDADRGDIARIVFYMNTRWSLEINKNTIGELRTFLKWHLEDEVDDFERHRNDVIYSYQKNRNPYIDHPELVEKVYGPLTTVMEFNDLIISLFEDKEIIIIDDKRYQYFV